MINRTKTKKLIKNIYSCVKELKEQCPERSFTPDGHMVGSIGDMLAQYYYGLKLYSESHKKYDGWVMMGGKKREVQVRTTQGKGTYLKEETDLLLVLIIDKNGEYEEIYNGDGIRPWQSLSHRKKPGDISISLRQLKRLRLGIKTEDKIKKIV